MDSRLYIVGNGEIDAIGTVTDIDVSVRLVFVGISLDVKIPRGLILDERGVNKFSEGETVKITALVQESSFSKTYERSSYVAKALTVKRVLTIEKVKG